MYKKRIKKNIEEWIKHLRSGEFKQTRSWLKRVNSTNGECSYCCLGLACDTVFSLPSKELKPGISADTSPVAFEVEGDCYIDQVLSTNLYKELGLNSNVGVLNRVDNLYDNYDEFFPYLLDAGRYAVSLAELNDNGATFEQLANFMEAKPELVFSDPEFYPTPAKDGN
jgi:hypothetical protein